MPTTPEEARAIVCAAREYVSPAQLYALFSKLDSTVGRNTDNSSVRDTLAMLREEAARLVLADIHSEPAETPARAVAHPFLRAVLFAFLVLWVAGHVLYILTILASFFVLPFYAPWYVAAPLMAVPPVLAVNRGPCPLTTVENWLRTAIGLPTIGGFIKHYFVKPAVACFRYVR